MTNEEFITMAKLKVKKYTYKNIAKDGTSLFHVYVVWQAKILQNYKALLATDIEGDQHYYLPTNEGDMAFNEGDYIATGVDGEHWAIDQDIFERTYERVD